MMRKMLFVIAAPALLLVGCATTDDAGPDVATLDGSELHGRTVRVTMNGTVMSRTVFNPDGTFRANWTDGRVDQGAYRVRGDQMCLTYSAQPPRPEECWAYQRMTPGRAYTVTAPNGAPVQLTVEP